MLSVERNKCLRCRWIPPDLTQHTYVHSAHQLLAEDIEAMSYLPVSLVKESSCRSLLTDMRFQNIIVVLEGSMSKSVVIVEIVVE